MGLVHCFTKDIILEASFTKDIILEAIEQLRSKEPIRRYIMVDRLLQEVILLIMMLCFKVVGWVVE